MEQLKGKTILIGKEPSQGRLLVALPGSGKSAAIGLPGSVPASVSRCRPAEGIAHAKISIDQSGNIILTNLKSQNATYVNGSEIESKRIVTDSLVSLGKDHFAVSVPLILETARKLVAVGQERPQTPGDSGAKRFNIAHLEHVWNDLIARRKEVQAKQKQINLVRSGCGVFTMCAMPCIFLFGPIGYVLTGIGIIGNIHSFVGLKNDDASDVLERLNEDFQDRYVCPNPDCNKFLGNLSYRLLKRQYSMHCPYCKCEYVEK